MLIIAVVMEVVVVAVVMVVIVGSKCSKDKFCLSIA